MFPIQWMRSVREWVRCTNPLILPLKKKNTTNNAKHLLKQKALVYVFNSGRDM